MRPTREKERNRDCPFLWSQSLAEVSLCKAFVSIGVHSWFWFRQRLMSASFISTTSSGSSTRSSSPSGLTKNTARKRSNNLASMRKTRMGLRPSLSQSSRASQARPRERWAGPGAERREHRGHQRTANRPGNFLRVLQIAEFEVLFASALLVFRPESERLRRG